VDLEIFCHGPALTEFSDAVDDGPVFVIPWTVDASAAIHYCLSSVGSICHCICYKLACIIYRYQIDQVEFEHKCLNVC